MRSRIPSPLRTLATLVTAAALAGALGVGSGPAEAASSPTPIRHVVVLYQENHSFNDVLGWLCVSDPTRCDGTDTGRLPNGSTIALKSAPDVVPLVDHDRTTQETAIDGGLMDGFARIGGCTKSDGYACYEMNRGGHIPNLAALAQTYAISDRTFELSTVPSWGAHLELVAGQLDGFNGNNPKVVTGNPTGPGWGCDSFRDTWWRPSPDAQGEFVPSCVPAPDGSGPYRASPVQSIPTIMDRMDAAGLSWRIYAPGPSSSSKPLGYGWAICPTFAECLNGPQSKDLLPSDQVVTDAEAGALPNLSIVIPSAPNSQHNGASMQQGDNWIGSVVNAVMQGPDWSSTAIFVTYDDCGCFYDGAAPPPGLGIRVPMVIVSPYARAGFTDHSVASFASLLAFTEHTFGLQPLASSDAGAYDYAGAFDFLQAPLQPVPLGPHPLPPGEHAWLAAHPPPADST